MVMTCWGIRRGLSNNAMKTILMISALDVWSMKKGAGAQSLWHTLKGYADSGWKVYFLNLEKNTFSRGDLHENICHISLNLSFLAKIMSIRKVRFFLRPIWWIFFQFGMIFIAHRVSSKHKIDLVYAYEIMGVPAGKLLSLRLKTPFVSRFQGTILKPKMDKPLWRVRHWHHYIGLKIPAELTIMTNDGTGGDEVLTRIGRDMNSIRFWMNGVDFDVYDPEFDVTRMKCNLGLNEQTVTILSVSRLVFWKRVDRIIKAMKEISDSFENVKLLIIGDGKERESLEALVSSLGVEDSVRFLGSLPQHQIGDYYNMADLFVSLYDLSNVGNPLLEAMICGKCIITLDNGETGTIISDQKNGILLDRERLSGLGKIICGLIRDKRKREYLGNGACDFAMKNFRTWDERIALEIGAVENLVARQLKRLHMELCHLPGQYLSQHIWPHHQKMLRHHMDGFALHHSIFFDSRIFFPKMRMFAVKRGLKKIILDYYLPFRKKLYRAFYPLKRKIYVPFDSTAFKVSLQKMGIQEGDSIFVMCSVNNIYRKTGYQLPVHIVLNELLEYLGPCGTITTLAFSADRQDIIDGVKIFSVRKTLTMNGMFPELLRRKTGAVRSLHPIFSAVSFGEKSNDYCNEHHLSPYPFGEQSPYRKITEDGGKYLGIGVGFEAFTPGHMVDDYYKNCFIHKMYEEKPRILLSVDQHGNKKKVETFVRRKHLCVTATHRKTLNYFNQLQPIDHIDLGYENGIRLFSMNMNSFFKSAIRLYNDTGKTFWAN